MTFTGMHPNPHRLYRDTRRGLVAGVCAGIADYIGVEPIVVRLGFALALLLAFVPAVVAYIALAVILKPRPPTLYASREEEAFWRGVATAPDDTLQSLRRKFAELEARLRHMGTQIASREYELHRKFRDLGG